MIRAWRDLMTLTHFAMMAARSTGLRSQAQSRGCLVDRTYMWRIVSVMPESVGRRTPTASLIKPLKFREPVELASD